MAIAHLLEDFSVGSGSQSAVKLMTEDELDDLRLAAYEQGYTSGWDDGIAAQNREHSRITGTLAQNLEDLSFTYHEALSQMLREVEPVFRSLTETVLPDMMARSVGQHIVETLTDLAREQGNKPATIRLSPDSAGMLADIQLQDFSMPVTIVEDPSFEPGQASLRVGSGECEIDTERLLTSVRDAVDAFFYQINKEAMNE